MPSVYFSPKSLDDIERIEDYIRNTLLNAEAATKFVADVFAACDSLAEKPRPGAPFRSDLNLLKFYRYLSVGRYLVVFRVQDDKVMVIRVLHELQDTVSILLRNH